MERMNMSMPYGQYIYGVDGGSKWRTNAGQTDVRLNGWCVGGLGQQRDDGLGTATMYERKERVESPVAYVDD